MKDIAGIIFFVVLFYIAFCIQANRLNSIKKSPHITIGTIKQHIWTEYGWELSYEYKIYGEVYEGNAIIPTNMNSKMGHDFAVGKKFFVRFRKDCHTCSIIELDGPVPDSIQQIPTEGWTRIPTKKNF